ncbi:MAG: AAA-like domain-containing protein, partial [Microcystaceae cyanobacterium]
MAILKDSPRYKVGGSLTFNHPSYVEREADRQLGAALRAGKFCYVFNCRQMGKSSLRVRAMHQLQAEGHSCASVDITSLGSDIDSSQWYNGIITQLFLSFNFVGKINLKIWLRERDNLPPVQKLSQFLETVVLQYATGKQVFIFIDEIDKVLSLKFSLDDFFSLIRYCYNQRAEDANYNRLSFALFGVATPSDLIREKTQTPFNIGTAIALKGFTLAEIEPLAGGLTENAENTEKVLAEILNWTGGQPFLTQKICDLICQQKQWIAQGEELLIVNQLIQAQILQNWESQDEPVHLKTIRDRLLRDEQTTGRLLGLYQNILETGKIKADDSSEQSELKLSGLVVKQESYLIPYNYLYQEVFNLDWVHQQLAKIRPYSESIITWENSQYQDHSRLLRG